MRRKLQCSQEVTIHVPLEIVWEFGQDLTRIPQYHPRVVSVDLLSGSSLRAAGVAYQCHLNDGKNTCIEKDVEIVPFEKITTVFPEDTLGISKLLPDYVVETLFSSVDKDVTRVEFRHYYSTDKWMARLLNGFIRRRIAKESQQTLNAVKRVIESEYRVP
jgi:Polyketide cyclase / dehydrase and lipid transport